MLLASLGRLPVFRVFYLARTIHAGMQDIKAAKTALRKQVATTLRSLSEQVIARQSDAVTRTVLQSAHYKEAKNLSIYLAMPGKEIQTTHIAIDALSRGKGVFVPYITKSTSSMEMLRIRDVEDLKSLKPDNWGIPTLPKEGLDARDTATGKLDLVLMPAVAFDSQMRRLGHGKGYYDRYLEQYRNAQSQGDKMPYLAGLALSEQFLSSEVDIPTSDSDWTVDVVFTENGSKSSGSPAR